MTQPLEDREKRVLRRAAGIIGGIAAISLLGAIVHVSLYRWGVYTLIALLGAALFAALAVLVHRGSTRAFAAAALIYLFDTVAHLLVAAALITSGTTNVAIGAAGGKIVLCFLLVRELKQTAGYSHARNALWVSFFAATILSGVLWVFGAVSSSQSIDFGVTDGAPLGTLAKLEASLLKVAITREDGKDDDNDAWVFVSAVDDSVELLVSTDEKQRVVSFQAKFSATALKKLDALLSDYWKEVTGERPSFDNGAVHVQGSALPINGRVAKFSSERVGALWTSSSYGDHVAMNSR